MAVIPLFEFSKRNKRNRDNFLRLVGDCVTRWAFIDRMLFVLFLRALNLDVKGAGIIYYRLTTLNSKIDLVDRAIGLVATPATLKVWKRHKKKMEELLPVRNIIAHHPLLQEISGSGRRSRHRYSIRIEPYEIEIGRRVARSVYANELRQHSVRVDKLTHRLATFSGKVMKDARARAQNLPGDPAKGRTIFPLA
jgi:hypothetical protein